MSNHDRAGETAAHRCAPGAEAIEPVLGAASQPADLLKVAFDQAYDAVVITTPELDMPGPEIVYVNAAFTRITGYEAAEVIGKTPRILQGHKTQRDTLDELRGRLSQGLSFEGQAINYRKDGSEFWLEWRIAPVCDAEGRVMCWISLQRDVTDRKRMEAQQQRFTAELEARVKERTERLAAANAENERLLQRESEARARAETAHAQLEADNRVKDEFLALLAHELRNPMAAIATAAQLLAPEPANPMSIARARAVIERQTAHLSRMLDDLLDVARLTAGTIALRQEPLDLERVVSDAIETSRPLIDARRHTLTASLPPERVLVQGDVMRLSQAVSNLLANAARYTPEAGRISVEVERENGWAKLQVRDTGMGIDSDLLGHVFDPFRQAGRDLARTQGGLGLGLTLTRRIVELHGGRIEAQSAGLGAGSVFTIHLPRMQPSPSQNAPAAHARDAPAQLRVLVVDDNEDIRDALAMLLSARGHDVRAAEDGSQALQAVKEFAPDIVLLDIGLPGLDGYEVARRVRAAGNGQVRLVALTGYGREQDRAQSRAAGFDAHLVKPVTMQALDRELTQASSRTRA